MFPNLKSKKFIDLSNNEQVSVIEQFENIAVLNDDTKINVLRLLDRAYYDEFVDPSDFFSSKSYGAFVDKVKSIPTESLENIKENDSDSAIIEYDPEEERRELMEKARQMSGYSEAANNQMDKFKDFIDEEDMPVKILPDRDNQVDIKESVSVAHQPIKDNSPIYEDPIISMFKNTKKNTSLKITIEIENKIPRPDFIEMMEDSYELSIIDYLSNEFTQKIISDPSFINDKIKEEIKKIVYRKKEIVPRQIKKTKVKEDIKNTN